MRTRKNTYKQHYQERSWTTLSELETLHQLCELEKTQILQSLALAVLKIPYAGYLLSKNRYNFLDYEDSTHEDSTNLLQDEDSTHEDSTHLPQDEDSTRLQKLSLMNNIIRTWNTTSIMRTRKSTHEQLMNNIIKNTKTVH